MIGRRMRVLEVGRRFGVVSARRPGWSQVFVSTLPAPVAATGGLERCAPTAAAAASVVALGDRRLLSGLVDSCLAALPGGEQPICSPAHLLARRGAAVEGSRLSLYGRYSGVEATRPRRRSRAETEAAAAARPVVDASRISLVAEVRCG